MQNPLNASRPFKFTARIAAALVILQAASIARAQESPWKPARAWIAGSKDHVFVVASNSNQVGKPGELNMWWSGLRSSGADQQPAAREFLPTIYGDPVGIGAASDGLKILYSDWTLWSYSATAPGAVDAVWKEEVIDAPLAFTCDDSQPLIAAIVRTASLRNEIPEVTADATNSPPGAIRAESAPAATRPAAPVPSTRHTLLIHRAGRWERYAISREADEAKAYWLAARNGRVHLFWRSADEKIRYAEWNARDWSAPELVAIDKSIRRAWAGSTANGPIFIAGMGPDIRSIQLHLIARSDVGQWTDTGRAREGTDYLTLDGVTAGVGTALGRLGVARIGDKDHVEFAWGDPTGSSVLRFAPLAPRANIQPIEPTWETVVFPAIVLVVMTAILLSRREQVMRPAAVPLGFAIAPVWKRAMATLVDILPAMLIGGLAMQNLHTEMNLPDNFEGMMDRFQNDPELLARTAPYYYVMVLIYGVWCAGWELASGTTLGKRLFRCRVLSIDGIAPTARQIIVRNIIRVLMVSLRDTGLLITFLTMVLLTRNCQRLGDVLANTMVVHPGPAGEIPIARPRDGDQPGSES